MRSIRLKASKIPSAFGAAVALVMATATLGAAPAQAQAWDDGWHRGPGYWQEREAWRERAWREHEWRIHHPYYVYDRYGGRPAYAYPPPAYYPPPPAYYPAAPQFGFSVGIR